MKDFCSYLVTLIVTINIAYDKNQEGHPNLLGPSGMRMNQAGAGGGVGYPSLTHELNLIPMVLELVEIIQNCGDQQEINRRVMARVMVLKYLSNRNRSSSLFVASATVLQDDMSFYFCFEFQMKSNNGICV